MSNQPEYERLRRWRLVLGGGQSDGICSKPGQGKGQGGGGEGDGEEDGMGGGFPGLNGEDSDMDKALEALYDSERSAGLGGSKPNVARWLGDIRRFFPSTIVRVMQKDAIERLNMRQLLMEPELLEELEPDVNLVADLVSLGSVLPNETKETARHVIRKVVEDLMKKLATPTRQAIMGSLNRAERNNRPRHHEIDWNRTIRANLKHYQADYKTIVPERRIGYGRKRASLRDVIVCVDQSGSMAASVVYASIFSAVLASLPAVKTQMVVFDTAVVDLTEKLSDPVEVLFGTQLGGGTDINRALGYCQGLIRRPQETIFVLISDLYEGGNRQEMLRRAAAMAGSGVQFVALLALNDKGAPSYDHDVAQQFAGFGIPSFACTPDLFPDLMAAAINKQDINRWAAANDIVTARRDG